MATGSVSCSGLSSIEMLPCLTDLLTQARLSRIVSVALIGS